MKAKYVFLTLMFILGFHALAQDSQWAFRQIRMPPVSHIPPRPSEENAGFDGFSSFFVPGLYKGFLIVVDREGVGLWKDGERQRLIPYPSRLKAYNVRSVLIRDDGNLILNEYSVSQKTSSITLINLETGINEHFVIKDDFVDFSATHRNYTVNLGGRHNTIQDLILLTPDNQLLRGAEAWRLLSELPGRQSLSSPQQLSPGRVLHHLQILGRFIPLRYYLHNLYESKELRATESLFSELLQTYFPDYGPGGLDRYVLLTSPDRQDALLMDFRYADLPDDYQPLGEGEPRTSYRLDEESIRITLLSKVGGEPRGVKLQHALLPSKRLSSRGLRFMGDRSGGGDPGAVGDLSGYTRE
jgi:hypothetical protein